VDILCTATNEEVRLISASYTRCEYSSLHNFDLPIPIRLSSEPQLFIFTCSVWTFGGT